MYIGRVSLFRNSIGYSYLAFAVVLMGGIRYFSGVSILYIFLTVTVLVIFWMFKRYYVKLILSDKSICYSFEKRNIFYKTPIEIPFSNIKTCSVDYSRDISAIGIKCFSGRYLKLYFDDRTKNDGGVQSGEDIVNMIISCIKKYNEQNPADVIYIKPPFYISAFAKYLLITLAVVFVIATAVRVFEHDLTSRTIGPIGLSFAILVQMIGVYFCAKRKYQKLISGA